MSNNTDRYPEKECEAWSWHPTAVVESNRIGRYAKIGAFVRVLAGATIGEHVDIRDHVLIENDVVLGDRVSIESGVQLRDGLRVEDEVFIGPNATFAVDRLERRSIGKPPPALRTSIKRGAVVCANATVLPGITIGASARVEAGAVVNRDVPPNAIVAGNPARITGYVDTPHLAIVSVADRPASGTGKALPILRVSKAGLRRIPKITDLRGALSFGEVGDHLPFEPKRFFAVYDVPGKEVRGEHAHRELHQFLICLKGSCAVVLDDGQARDEIFLDTPEIGLHIPPMIWGIQYLYSPDALMLVLASDLYRASDYIRDYDEFISLVRA